MDYQLWHGDCLEILPTIESGSVDAIFSDSPYPYIKRDYGYWTEEAWMPMMQEVVRQSRRVLKPHGSAVFILQPNSEKRGVMRSWLWKFMVWCSDEWNIIQDAYWWNYKTMPGNYDGLMRSSVKICIWIGESNCYRNQDDALWDETDNQALARRRKQFHKYTSPSGRSVDQNRTMFTSLERGGVTPYNMIPACHGYSQSSAGSYGHGAGTPISLVNWWLRYISKPGDTILDCFSGTATTGVAARRLGRKYIGIEQIEKYHEVAKRRLATALDDKPSKPANGKIEDLPMFQEVAA